MLRGVVPFVAAGAIVFGLPGAASAAVAPAGFVRTTVACPAGKVAIAGGAQVAGEGSRDFRTAIQESAPSGALWLVALRNNDVSAHNVALSAVCVSPPSGYEVVRKDFVVGAGGFAESFAQCPEGKVVFGGGAQVVGEGSRDFRTVIRQTAPDSVLGGTVLVWRAAVGNNDTAAHTIGVFAVCANQPTGYERIRRDVAVAAGGVLRSIVPCSAGRVVTGGGSVALGASGSRQTVVQESSPGSLDAATSVWLTAVRNGPTAQSVALLGNCAVAPAGYQVVQRLV
jgi:hypothetical protein